MEIIIIKKNTYNKLTWSYAMLLESREKPKYLISINKIESIQLKQVTID